MASLLFNASLDALYRNADTPTATAVTLAGWFKITGTLADYRAIAALGWQSGSRHQLMVNSGGRLVLDSGTFVTSADGDVDLSTWYYAALTASGSGTGQVAAYLWGPSGGTPIASLTADGIATAAGEIYLGGTGSANRQLDGLMAYGRVWGAALSQAELEDEMFSPTVVRTADFNSGFADSTSGVDPQSARGWTANGTVDSDSDTPPVLITTATRYNSFAELMADGTIDMDNDTFKVCLATSSYTPSATHTQLSDVSTYRVSGTTDVALTGVTWAQTSGTAKFDASDTDSVFSTTQAVKYAVIYSDTSTNDNLVCYITLPDSTTITGGDTLRLVWDAAGIFTLA